MKKIIFLVVLVLVVSSAEAEFSFNFDTNYLTFQNGSPSPMWVFGFSAEGCATKEFYTTLTGKTDFGFFNDAKQGFVRFELPLKFCFHFERDELKFGASGGLMLFGSASSFDKMFFIAPLLENIFWLSDSDDFGFGFGAKWPFFYGSGAKIKPKLEITGSTKFKVF